MSRPVRFFSDLRSLVAIYKILRREKPDVVHTHTAKAGTLGRIAAILARVPVRVHTFHGHVFSGYFGQAKTRAYASIERFLARFTTRIVTVSEGQARELSEIYRIASRAKIQVMRNGFDWNDSAPRAQTVRSAFGIRPDQMVVLWMGRMVPIKGVALLADVIRACATNPALLFLVAGDGPERGGFEQQVQGCDNVRMLGWREDVRPLWAACDIALLTSANEGTPTSLIEAMFAGKPFVATDAGGTAELAVDLQPASDGVRRASNGSIVESMAATIADYLAELARDPALRESLGRAGQVHAQQNWTSERLLKDVTQLYRELALGSKSRAHSA